MKQGWPWQGALSNQEPSRVHPKRDIAHLTVKVSEH